MVETLEDLHFTPCEGAALRLMQVALFAEDLLGTTNVLQLPAKREALREFSVAVVEWVESSGFDGAGTLRETADLSVLGAVAQDILPHLRICRQSVRCIIALDLLADTRLPAKTKWAIDRVGLAGHLLSRIYPGTRTDTHNIARMHKDACKRLAQDASSPTMRLGIVGGGTLLGSFIAGPAGSAIGTLVGNAMGLSGAAATSAGLAWLGGGSLAAGGFGMAGGSIVVLSATKVTMLGAARIAADLATASPGAFINELGKLELVVQDNPALRDEVLRRLVDTRQQIREQHSRDTDAEKSMRALDGLTRKLTDTGVQRPARWILRRAPVPRMDGLIDRLTPRSDLPE